MIREVISRFDSANWYNIFPNPAPSNLEDYEKISCFSNHCAIRSDE